MKCLKYCEILYLNSIVLDFSVKNVDLYKKYILVDIGFVNRIRKIKYKNYMKRLENKFFIVMFICKIYFYFKMISFLYYM